MDMPGRHLQPVARKWFADALRLTPIRVNRIDSLLRPSWGRVKVTLLKILTVGLLPLVAACAGGSKNVMPRTIVAPPGLTVPAVWIEVRLKEMGVIRRKPERVLFARISGINGSPCVPREAVYDPDLSAPASLDGVVGHPLATVGSVDGEGGFSAGGDATCMYDENGLPVWDPILYKSSGVKDGKAYLDGLPPGRYTAVAAEFSSGQGNRMIVYFPTRMINLTETAVLPGEVTYMGYYETRAPVFGDYDPLQARYREVVAAEGPDKVQRAVSAMVSALLDSQSAAGFPVHRAGEMIRVDQPASPSRTETSEATQ